MKSSRSILLVLCTLLLLSPARGQSAKENADFKLAINLYNDGLYDLAAEQLGQFINSFPAGANSIEARFYLGLTQMKLKQYDDARLTFQTFALTYQDNPKAPDAWLNVGECYVAIKNYKEAALAFERVKVFHARSKVAPEALIKASKYFTLAGQPDDARRVLRITLQEYANSSASLQARSMLAQIYFDEGNLVQAQNELKRVIEGDPSPDAQAQALLILGNIYQAMGQSTQARGNYEEVITKHKGSTAVQGAYLNLGKLLLSAGKFGEAIDNFKKALGNQPDSSLIFDAQSRLGDSYLALGDGTNALASFEKSIGYAPSSEERNATLWKIATTAARGKNWSKSTDACNRIVKSNAPDQLKRNALLRLALNAESKREYNQAVQHFTIFLDQRPNDPLADEIAFRSAGLVDKELRETRKAATAYEQFISRFPVSPYIDDAYALAARCYDNLKEFERSRQLYRDLVDRFPSSEFRGLAEDRMRSIETFESRDKDAGVEKLALLLGDVVGDKDRIGLSFRLGEIYFNDLKNYSAAASQFSNAINSGMSDNRFVDALYYRARSLEYLSWREKKFAPQAVEAYQTFLQSYPNDPRSDDATLSVFLLSATSLQAARSSYEATLSANPEYKKQDLMLERIGMLAEQTDSMEEALSTYQTIIRQFKDSPTLAEVGYRRIALLFTTGGADSAMRESEEYLNLFPHGPHSAEVTSRLADALAQSGSSDRAVEYYRRLHDDFGYASSSAAVSRKLADAYATMGKYDDAISLYSEILTEQNDNLLQEAQTDASLLLAIGKAYNALGKTDEAKKYLLHAVSGESSGDIVGSAYNTLGVIARNEGNMDLATSYFRQAAAAAPNAASNRDIANLLFENGAYTEAIKQFSALSQSAENDSDHQYYESRIIIARYKNNDLTNAERDQASFIKKFDSSDEEMAAFELEKGLYYYRREENASARKSFDRVVGKYDETASAPIAMYWIGKILESTRKQPEALKQYEALMKQYPSSAIVPRAYLALGNIYYDMEKWDESVRNYKMIVENPAADKELLPIAMSNLIETYETAGIFDAALQLTRKYLELYPNNDDSFDKKIKIGILYQRLGYNDQAVLHLQTLLDQAGSDLEGEIRYYIAEANYNKGDFQQAILDFLKVPYLVTKKGKLDWTANSLYMAGQSYEKLGRYDQALTMYQQITERPGIDETFKAAAKKEIDRVKLVLKRPGSR